MLKQLLEGGGKVPWSALLHLTGQTLVGAVVACLLILNAHGVGPVVGELGSGAGFAGSIFNYCRLFSMMHNLTKTKEKIFEC